MLGAVIMDGRGLVDPRNKPFGRVLPLEIQIRIMFWVHYGQAQEGGARVERVAQM